MSKANETGNRPDPDSSAPEMTQAAPESIGGIVRRIGPGLIIAGSIVGSGELIATTISGAKAGFWLLWLIVLGCVIKVFVQVEFGRHTIISGETTLYSLNTLPGPRVRAVSWIVWYWLIMFLVIIGQQGGIVGGVGQALAISAPLTSDGKLYNQIVDAETQLQVQQRYVELFQERNADDPDYDAKLVELQQGVEANQQRLNELGEKPGVFYDDRLWATIIAVGTSALLIVVRYGLIQFFATAFVGTFTVITIVNLLMLQSDATLGINASELADGLKFRLPPPEETHGTENPLVIALAAFGIIGVGAAELVAYSYWCLEKGYARFTGPRDDTPAWAERARGWMRVMHWDVFLSMAVYTFATAAFYLLGAATLGRFRMDAEGTEMIRSLSVMFEPVFGSFAQEMFLFGAIAVLYSTFFVAAASNSRVLADCCRVFGVDMPTEQRRQRWVQLFSGLLPLISLVVYLFVQAPKALVLASGVMQALMLPMLSFAALYYRYRRIDVRLKPSSVWDAFLWISGVAMLIAGVTLFVLKVSEFTGGG